MLLNTIQNTPNSNDIKNIASGQNYTASGVLLLVAIGLGVWIYFITKSHKKERSDMLSERGALIKDKDEQIMKVVDEHKADLKDANKDYQTLVNKYHEFTDKVKQIADGRIT